jgi:hypothetical protein
MAQSTVCQPVRRVFPLEFDGQLNMTLKAIINSVTNSSLKETLSYVWTENVSHELYNNVSDYKSAFPHKIIKSITRYNL